MYSKYPFPISMENIPRQRTFFCLSLRFASIFTALIVIVYSLFNLAQSCAVIHYFQQVETQVDEKGIFIPVYIISVVHILNDATTFCLTSLMLIGALKSSANFIRPWVIWSSIQLIVYIILFVWATTAATLGHTSEGSLMLFVLQFLILVIEMYMLILVASYYKQLVEDDEERDRLKSLINHEIYNPA